MKYNIKSLNKLIIFYSILYLLIFLLMKTILKIFNIAFREWFVFLSIIIIAITFIIGIIQLLLKVKPKFLKILSVISFIVLLLLISPFAFVISAFIYMPEHVVEKDNKKYVAYVNSWLDTRVEYYDYINFLLKKLHT